MKTLKPHKTLSLSLTLCMLLVSTSIRSISLSPRTWAQPKKTSFFKKICSDKRIITAIGITAIAGLIIAAYCLSDTGNRQTPLHDAALAGNVNEIERLIEEKGTEFEKQKFIHAKNENGQTALHFAVKHGHLDVVELLLIKHKANSHIVDNHKRTPLHLAAEGAHLLTINQRDNAERYAEKQEKSVKIAQRLIDSGAFTYVTDYYDRTPLHDAMLSGNTAVANILLTNSSIDLNAQDYEGCTPLHTAARKSLILDADKKSEYLETVKLLLDRGANIELKDKKGKTALETAAIGYEEANCYDPFSNKQSNHFVAVSNPLVRDLLVERGAKADFLPIDGDTTWEKMDTE